MPGNRSPKSGKASNASALGIGGKARAGLEAPSETQQDQRFTVVSGAVTAKKMTLLPLIKHAQPNQWFLCSLHSMAGSSRQPPVDESSKWIVCNASDGVSTLVLKPGH